MKKLSMTLVISLAVVIAVSAFAQDEQSTRPRSVGDDPATNAQGKPADKSTPPVAQQTPTPAKEGDKTGGKLDGSKDVPPNVIANRREQQSEEEAAVLPYYNNFLTAYRLGPEDVISVTVFGHEPYSKGNIVIPPDGRISYPLIPEGVFVAGKTTQQVQDDLTKKLDEYIIDPKVTVALEKAMSARYSVLGDVAQPGIHIMTRRLSVYEAVAEAGGVLSTGDKSKVFVLRRQADGLLKPLLVNLKDIERGRAKEMTYLSPGDQVIVPGNRLKTIKQVMDLASIASFARVFATGY